jgi:diguanylate cyclase (GGDEF)-like protein
MDDMSAAPVRRRGFVAVGALLLVAFTVVMTAALLPPQLGQPLSYAVRSLTVLVACAAMVVRARQVHDRLRRARLLVAASLLCGALGGVLALILSVVLGEAPPVPSVSDAVYFLFLPLCVAGLLSYPVSDAAEGSPARSLLDGAMATVALWLVTHVVLLEPAQVGAGLPLATRLTALAYPAAGVFVIGMLAGVLVRVAPQARRELLVIGGGLCLLAVSDLAYVALQAQGRYRPDSWVAALAEWGLVLIVVGAAWRARSGSPSPRWTRWIPLLPYVPVIVALAVCAGLVAQGRQLHRGELATGIVLVTVLLLRQAVGGRDRRNLTERLSAAAFSDPLTGLGNLAQARRLLAQRCDEGGAAVVLVDLDGFKQVNDTFGHAHGDAMLVAVAARLRTCIASPGEVMRLGGDEFLAVLPSDAAGATTVADAVLAAMTEPLVVAGTPVTVQASVGVATTADAADPEELLRNADLAMYAAKAAGRNRRASYAPTMHRAARRRMEVNAGLRRALDKGELWLAYQPIVRLADGAVVGAEALLRWDDPTRGPVPPDTFVPVAEESGLIGEIDRWVLENVCADIAVWTAAGVTVPQVSVNVSRRQTTSDLPSLVADVLSRHAVSGNRLCLEVTESAVLLDLEAAVAALDAVRELGVGVALDDFGTGQSSLSQLARLPVDSVKIDKSFVVPSRDRAALRLLTSIVGVCRALSLPVVAEGVERQEVASLLHAIGCQTAQGFHFGRPGPGAAFIRRLGVALPAARAAEPDAHRVPR